MKNKCAECGKEFETNPYAFSQRKQKYCSVGCQLKARQRQMRENAVKRANKK